MYDVVRNSPFDVESECTWINKLFCSKVEGLPALRDVIDASFEGIPTAFRGRTLSIEDYNKTYGLDYPTYYRTDDIENFIGYCEYIINFCTQLEENEFYPMENEHEHAVETLRKTILSCMDEIGQIPAEKDVFTIFVDKDPAALAVAEIVDEKLVFPVLEYNHHRLKGDLNRKQLLLKLFADDFESKRRRLKSIAGSVESQLGELMNKFVRHNHSQTPYIASLTETQLEGIYDDIYQLYLLGNLQLDNLDRKKRMAELLSAINGK